ncbi:alpha/beta-hydrolase [Anaeromyces robustus]|jgi:enterochelin esterase-like enzyme|uniref:Alpha/beta-hydrolase n=1 Tax=Anaeromyces robustus TaxID=1754192 RepID=A0A1Y1WXQ8_9FUNG|nr:alpha/beta-hydrolase [Anaeromyces robustus]|eukprot:ORX78165.1 alpha/beta-hydrolase [Anaeromyces robustus]
MKYLSTLSLLLAGLGTTLVRAYDECKACNVVYVEGDEKWGVENNDWCIIPSKCDNGEKECFAYPLYNCCKGCDVIEESDEGKWGIENGYWCGIKDSCFKTDEPVEEPVVGNDYVLKDGWYTIKNPNSNKYLQVSYGRGGDAVNVVIGSNPQKWKLENVGDGYVTLLTMYGDYMLDVAAGDSKDGANIQIYSAYGGDAQQFAIIPTSNGNTYVIGSKVSNGEKVLDIEKASTSEGSNVLQWVNGEKANQTWIFESVSAPSEEEVNPPKSSSNFQYEAYMQYRDAPGNYLNSCPQAGRIIKESYNGINGGNSLNVYLPYGYDKNKQYNIFYLMHGGGENENTIFSRDVNLQPIIDNLIMNGELEPLIIVTPTFNKCEARTFYREFRESVIPFVEGKYSTYAKSTSANDIKASRMHRAFGGFSMGSASTWAVLVNCIDIVGYFMPLSGDNWEADGGYGKAKSVADAINRAGFKKDEFYIFAATGSEDIAYPNMNPQMDEMKKMDPFVYTSDFSKGNFYYLVAPGKTHWWGYVKHYIYDALPSFFHEKQD